MVSSEQRFPSVNISTSSAEDGHGSRTFKSLVARSSIIGENGDGRPMLRESLRFRVGPGLNWMILETQSVRRNIIRNSRSWRHLFSGFRGAGDVPMKYIREIRREVSVGLAKSLPCTKKLVTRALTRSWEIIYVVNNYLTHIQPQFTLKDLLNIQPPKSTNESSKPYNETLSITYTTTLARVIWPLMPARRRSERGDLCGMFGNNGKKAPLHETARSRIE